MAALEASFWHEAHASLTILRLVPHCESCTLGSGPHALSVNTPHTQPPLGFPSSPGVQSAHILTDMSLGKQPRQALDVV